MAAQASGFGEMRDESAKEKDTVQRRRSFRFMARANMELRYGENWKSTNYTNNVVITGSWKNEKNDIIDNYKNLHQV